jgi:hypothetical protein
LWYWAKALSSLDWSSAKSFFDFSTYFSKASAQRMCRHTPSEGLSFGGISPLGPMQGPMVNQYSVLNKAR